MPVLLSIAVGIAALVWSGVAYRQRRDWRLGYLSVALALMTISFSVHLYREPDFSWHVTVDNAMGLVISVIALMGVYVLSRMVDEARLSHRAIREREQRLKLVLEQVPSLVWTTDTDLRFTSSTGSGLRHLGLKPNEVVGLTLFEYFGTDNEGFYPIAQHRRALQGESVTYEFDWDELSFDVRVEPLRDSERRVTGTVGTALDVTERHKAERLLRRLAIRLQSVREDERTAIAHEIHDELGQALTGLKLELAWLRDRLDGELLERAKQAVALVDTTLDNSRKLAARLRPSVLDDLGLEAAIESQARDFAARTGCHCDIDLKMGEITPDKERDTAVFRILQEALTNVARHAEARRVRVTTRRENGALLMSVEDDGKGIPEEARTASFGSLGLLGMRERAGALGGRLDVHALDGGGTVVTLEMPLEQNE